MVPLNKVSVVMVSGGVMMVSVKFLVAVFPALSATPMVKLKVPLPVGVPLSTPVVRSRVKPAGPEPVAAQVYGGSPPLAAKVCE